MSLGSVLTGTHRNDDARWLSSKGYLSSNHVIVDLVGIIPLAPLAEFGISFLAQVLLPGGVILTPSPV